MDGYNIIQDVFRQRQREKEFLISTRTRATKAEERLFIDTSGPHRRSIGEVSIKSR